MIYNTQTDIKWRKEIMTEGQDFTGRKWVDYIGQGGYGNSGWGCLLTALANIFQVRIGQEFTPKRLNEVLKANKGYSFLNDPKKTPESMASFIEWSVIEKLFQLKIFRYEGIGFYRGENGVYWIARILKNYKGSLFGHYINVIDHDHHGNFWCFDVLTGKIESHFLDISHMIKVGFHV